MRDVKLVEISMTFTVTDPERQYHTVKPSIRLSATPDEGQSVESCHQETVQLARKLLAAQAVTMLHDVRLLTKDVKEYIDALLVNNQS